MAEFAGAIGPLLAAEGGHVNNPADKGGETYRGIARKFWPQWAGWTYLDSLAAVPERLVADFYRDQFWALLRGDQMANQRIANVLFSYAVNAGVKPAIKMAQQAVCVTADGVVGPMTLFALNSVDPDLFLARYALARIQHRVKVCIKDPSQKVFLLGWISRDLKEGT